MIDKQREKFIDKIKWYESAIKNTKSKYLKRDYQKAVKRMRLELMEYDRYHSG